MQINGTFQLVEWKLLDSFFQMRSLEKVDPQIVMVTFDDTDIARVGKWPFSDAVVARLISKIKQDKPKVIGLDLYRNLTVEPGKEELNQLFSSTKNLIVTEKFVEPSVPPPPQVNYEEQVGFVDTVVDLDGTVRRALLSIEKPNGNLISSFGVKVAFKYLESLNIFAQPQGGMTGLVTLGKLEIKPFHSYQAGYAASDIGGYQTLINYRCLSSCFENISMNDVITGKYSKGLFNNRIVLIGSTAESLRDFFLSPYGKISGVYIHANIISQLINGAIDDRPLLETYPKLMEGVWVLLWAYLGATGISGFLKANGLGKIKFVIGILGFLVFGTITIFSISYVSFLFSFWLPILPTLSSFLLSSFVCIIYLGEKFRYASNIDELTQIANRRYFDRFLLKSFTAKQRLSVILCDIDHFKLYNDTYGHQAGDKCLQQVAQALSQSVRNGELAGRYGGEEFAVVLPNTNYEAALSVAERIVTNVRALNIPHRSSKTSNIVTLSCGVADMTDEDGSSFDLLIKADRALYRAKEAGRDRALGYVKKNDDLSNGHVASNKDLTYYDV
jgi:diguanylate cyclase (GGDEF)-like protein